MFRILVFLSLMVGSFSAFASDELISVSDVHVTRHISGVPGGSATRLTLEFQAVTIGSCDNFSAKVDEVDGKVILTILKETIAQCTRPEHYPYIEPVSIQAPAGDWSFGTVVLANPLFIHQIAYP